MKKEINNKYIIVMMYIIPIFILGVILLSFWPGIYTSDGLGQWHQAATNNISNAHPFFSTFFLLVLSKIWNHRTVQLIFQILLFSIIWGSICKEMIKEKKNIKSIVIYTIFLCIFPVISIYSITQWKDVIYSYYLFSVVFLMYIGSKNNYKYNIIQYILFGILFFLIFSYRHNGMIASVLLMIILIVLTIKNKNNFKKSLLTVVTFILLIGIFSIPKNYYLSKYESPNKTISTSTFDTYATWIMGAHINEDYVSEKDLEFLNNYIEINEWKEVYDPFLINATNLASIKNNEFILENNKQFKKIFFKYLVKHPFTVVKHYLNADALLWSPIPIGYVYQYDFVVWGPDYSFNLGETSKLPLLNSIYEKFITLTMRRPIRVILYQPATIMYISLILIFILVKSLKNKKLWLIASPMLCNIVSLLPINIAQDLRYVYINYLTLAFVLFLCVLNIDEIKNYLKSNVSCRKKGI